MRTKRFIPVLFAAMVAAPLAAQTKEGYDPLRQITQLVTDARLLIVLDVTGSMAGDVAGNNLTNGDDSTGHLFWTFTTTGCNNSSKNCIHTYELRWENPSRLASVKNALGNSVSLATGFVAPADWKTWWGGRATNSKYPAASITWPAGGGTGPWQWKIDFGTYSSNRTDYGPPIHVSCGDAGVNSFSPAPVACGVGDYPTPPPICSSSPSSDACTPPDGFPLVKGQYTFLPPADVVGTNADQVRWGLVSFSTSRQSICATPSTLVSIDTGASPSVTLLEQYLQLTSNTWSGSIGLKSGGYTNTRAALDYAKSVLKDTFATDPRANCNPPYGVILATDGLSNSCNPLNSNWIRPCGGTSVCKVSDPNYPSCDAGKFSGGCTGPTCCDVGSSEYDCPSKAASFAAEKAHEIWNLNLGGNVHPRTWAIGVSTQVGPCELDFIAWAGRTDASSPNGDAGWNYTLDRLEWPLNKDPKQYVYLLPQTDAAGGSVTALPDPSPANIPDPTVVNYDGPTGQYKWFRDTSLAFNPATKTAPYTNHGHYAFFATTAGSIADAFTTIVSSTAAGDYATNAPTAGSSVGAGSTVLLATAEFPGWKGHLYAFDTAKAPNDAGYVKWDAGALLTDPSRRKIYTWKSDGTLVPVIQGRISDLGDIAVANGLAAKAQFTGNVIDFIRGYDGTMTSKPRAWMLGPLINATPSIIGPPIAFLQGLVRDHSAFEATYRSRRALAWVGSDDGMLHAFDFLRGTEEMAIIPPDLLPLQVTLYGNYYARTSRVTGQLEKIKGHLYGVANSLRFADVYLKDDGKFHTIGFLSEGPGGTTIAALDLTHPYAGDATVVPTPIPSDPNYDATAPFTVLWSVQGGTGAGQLPGLYKSWSIPAVAATQPDVWDIIFGGGANPASTASGQVAPKVFTADISTKGTNPTFKTSDTTNSGVTALVGNQTFADSVVYSTLAAGYHSDNIADAGVQADLNGRIWFLAKNDLSGSIAVGIDATAAAGAMQPIYYPPAVSGYGPNAASCDSYAFGSGTFYESSSKVTGPNVGKSGNFIPSVYIAVGPKPTGGAAPKPLASSQVTRLPITGTVFSQGDKAHPELTRTLGARTQMTASPFLISPVSGSGPVQALFLVYDPDNGCTGRSYVLSILFTVPANCAGNPVITEKIAYDAGPGALSGLTSAGNKILGSTSGLGSGVRAGLFEVKVELQPGSTPRPRPVWWKEHK